MPDDFGSFAREINLLANEVPEIAHKEVFRVAVRVHAKLVERTPVDTGFARVNWLIRAGAPSYEVSGNSKDKDSNGTPGSAHSNQKTNAIFAKPGQTIFITNGVGYVVKLNANGSTKARASTGRLAPRGWIDRAIEEGKSKGKGRRSRGIIA